MTLLPHSCCLSTTERVTNQSVVPNYLPDCTFLCQSGGIMLTPPVLSFPTDLFYVILSSYPNNPTRITSCSCTSKTKI